MKLKTAQKYTLSALYEIFGEGMFSAVMAIAQLDYSSAHLSGILHQFTWMKLLDCTPNEGNSYTYQLNVNPTDNPECFEDVAKKIPSTGYHYTGGGERAVFSFQFQLLLPI